MGTFGKFGLIALVALVLVIPLHAQKLTTPQEGGTGTNVSFSPGSLVFAGPLTAQGFQGIYAQDNTYLRWDFTNHRFATPVVAPVVYSIQVTVLAPTPPGTTTAFNAALGTSFKLALTSDTTLAVTGATAGQVVTALICQDGTGSHTFTWPATFKGGLTVAATASECNAQQFICDGTNCYALSAGATGL